MSQEKSTSWQMFLIVITTLVLISGIAGILYVSRNDETISKPPVSITIEPKDEKIENEVPMEAISYENPNFAITLNKSIMPFSYNAEELTAMAEECGNQTSPNYFSQLLEKFSQTDKTVYSFNYVGASQEADTFIITVIPNKANYKTMEEFKNDFDICGAGGEEYPSMLNDNWLLFVNACGSGFDDGSGAVNGCSEIKTAIEPSLKLN